MAILSTARHFIYMAEPTPKSEGTFTFTWSDRELPLFFADNMHWRNAGDRAYLTFGQLQLPLGEGPLLPGDIEIRPVARLVTTPAAIRIWAELLMKAAKEFESAPVAK